MRAHVTGDARPQGRLFSGLLVGEISPEVSQVSQRGGHAFDAMLNLSLTEELCELLWRAWQQLHAHELAEDAVRREFVQPSIEGPDPQEVESFVQVLHRSFGAQDAVFHHDAVGGRPLHAHTDAVDVAFDNSASELGVVRGDRCIVADFLQQPFHVFLCRKTELLAGAAQEHLQFCKAEERRPLHVEVGLEHSEPQPFVSEQRQSGHIWGKHLLVSFLVGCGARNSFPAKNILWRRYFLRGMSMLLYRFFAELSRRGRVLRLDFS